MGRVENIVGKGEIAGYQCSRKLSSLRFVESWDCAVKGLTLY